MLQVPSHWNVGRFNCTTTIEVWTHITHGEHRLQTARSNYSFVFPCERRHGVSINSRVQNYVKSSRCFSLLYQQIHLQIIFMRSVRYFQKYFAMLHLYFKAMCVFFRNTLKIIYEFFSQNIITTSLIVCTNFTKWLNKILHYNPEVYWWTKFRIYCCRSQIKLMSEALIAYNY